ncbi:MAG: phosphate permease [Candidatus Muproteobacteria bacterium RIFCSPHIGHO2_12_FULL_60_33]|uniref:Phosphate transporter n=1 Tax=Candidatus Muproteobacteria bacterium RIFCSPLOWO2_01_FULL_60_18 TaxID=1817768 RepID=A0A1F6TZF9_9PROT|nr:MAG: phosphate permease [Candidatus Muproteobacteria bacterium RIFCSPLOWO2_01_FULL_60_18]OGI52406.1 MAG: phosphate permease [Candidatus Muproteobacteria bacterium RIFCSPHIGHO2_01_60_12]OGI54212.1 MAG: phosphate permease [Candidatus Muproteobacteria bacterium RIFCSPHIGHO2_12_FULL_60_33]OGI55321.1 MAG: phosphate permease [Candidatus Muproteobacteria bacterium RIFCSPHIGHO2_02_FULL_60_13]OGI59167.1 MAG: phosphate permease [Candidatus Muproteobacteria bacterium RIFCSPHIGHO2_01_FULL_61_200]
MELLAAVFFGVFLAYANGANDNFKGVATLFGSGTTDYRVALRWATAMTFAGSLVALALASELLQTFSGRGLVPEPVLQTKQFPMAVAFAAAFTVWLATRLGFPVSTTHAIMGALMGAGLAASPTQINFLRLGSDFFLPLALSPLLALGGVMLLYPAFQRIRARLGVQKEICVCVGTEVTARFPAGTTLPQAIAATAMAVPTVKIAEESRCREQYTGTFVGVNAKTVLNAAHFASAGAVCFARAVNDTPKIAAILLASQALSSNLVIVAVAVAMALGGLVSSRRVAETMAHRVTAMNAGQGFTANLVTSALVLLASKFGLAVSTTHVSCGALFGTGVVNGQAHWKTIAGIIAAWIVTLPVAAASAGFGFLVLGGGER